MKYSGNKNKEKSFKKDSRIFVAGGTGLVGSAIIRNLIRKGYRNIITNYHRRKPDNSTSPSSLPHNNYYKLDLTNQNEVANFFKLTKPEFIFLAAAKVGGIVANNTYRAQFIYENLQIQNNVIHSAYRFGTKKLLFLGSTCIYPKECPQPIKEEYLLTSPLEYTNEPYAIAKIAGIKMCENYNIQYNTNFIAIMPTNLYGPNDNFDLKTSHVLPALLRKFHIAKALSENNWDVIKKDLKIRPIEDVTANSSENEIIDILSKYGIKQKNNTVAVEIWGTGTPKREFLWVDDMADASVFIMENVNFPDIIKIKNLTSEIKNTHINIGTGSDISIKDLVTLIKQIVQFNGHVSFDTSKPDGTMRKLTDISTISQLGWNYKKSIKDGLKELYHWYLNSNH